MIAALLTLLLAAPSRARAASSPDGSSFRAAARHYAEKKYPLALEGFENLARSNAGSPAEIAAALTLLHLGRAVAAEKDFEAYAAAARRARTDAGPSMVELSAVSAPFILFGDEPGKAELLQGLLNSWTKAKPESVLAWEMLGYSGLASNDRGALDASVARLRVLTPESALPSFYAGFSAVLGRDGAAARAAFSEAARRDPAFASARAAQAQVPAGTDAGGRDPLARLRDQLFVLFAVGAAIFAGFQLLALAQSPLH
ncbi:MAG: hypothetical protein HKL90_02075 [Elusimicrobia bacterium]|nr:hypothetical protein [Elusimicrobiota bacterium]